MDRVHIGSLSACVGVVLVLAALDVGPAGWIAGAACGAGLAVLLDSALVRSGAPLGPAGWLTTTRAVLACGVAALTADALLGERPTAVLATLAAVALVLDAVDGQVARRTGTATALGARYDMEVDAFLIAVLSVYAAPLAGPWVLAIGAFRYAYVVATWLLGWLRRPLPPRYSAKVVAALQGIVLVVAAAEVLPLAATQALLVVALALLTWSFGHDVRLQWQHRQEPLVAAPRPRPLVAGGSPTVLATVLLWAALVVPDPATSFGPGDLARVPVEGLVLVAVALVLPAPARRWFAFAFGVVVGALVVVRVLNVGFLAVLDRRFDPLLDWSYLGPAVGVLGDSIGDGWARTAAGGAIVVVAAVLGTVALAARRVASAAAEHRAAALRSGVALMTVWVLGAVTGTPVASTTATALAVGTVGLVREDLVDQDEFAEEIEVDPFADTPAADLLTGLRGKDVLLVFVESYGRTATGGSSYAPGVTATLREGTRRLDAAGYLTRSAFLTSPTFGAASWLAHSTTQSGLWVDSEGRYRQLLESDRLTLTSAFERAGWRTVFDVPANTRDWPEGEAFYGFDEIYDSRNVGYAGPEFGYAPVPDQYTLEHFRRTELATNDRAPVFAEIDLISSHHPWTPPPPLVAWDDVGDGSVFAGTTEDVPEVREQDDPDRVRALYGRSIEYSWETLVSFLETYPDPDRVLVVLGDHEPHAYVSGEDAGHDVPVTVIAQDSAVVRRIEGWAWQSGLLPAADAPVWRMDSLRDRLLTAFGSEP